MTTIPAQSNLYSKDSGYPGPVTALYLPSGATRTNPSEFTTDEYTECGYTGPYTQPEYEYEVQDVTWDSGSKSFSVVSKPEEWWITQVKSARAVLFAKTDFAILSDTVLSTSDQNLIKTLRTGLRNIPQEVDAGNLAWPTTQAEFLKIFDDLILPCKDVSIDISYPIAGF